jgi:CubicO group peptidase (beta-lactamase class C family)
MKRSQRSLSVTGPASAGVLLSVLLCASIACSSPEHKSAGETARTQRPLTGEPLDTAPAAGSWAFEQSAANVTALLGTTNRLESIQVATVSPLTFTVSMVQNTGTYAKKWWWFPDLTPEKLELYTTVLNARVISMDAYVIGGVTHFAAVMISNTSTDAKTWSWFFGTLSDLSAFQQQKNARLVDFRQYANGPNTLYAAVMIANTDADFTPSWSYTGVSIGQINTLLSANDAFLVSVQPADTNGATFNVVMNRNPAPGIAWWTYYNYQQSSITSFLGQNKARPVDVKSYVVNGTRLFTMTMVGNTWTASQQAEAACDANVLAAWNATPPAVGLGSPATVAAVDNVIIPALQSNGVTGAAIAFTKNGRLVLARGYGFADSGTSQIAHPDSRFRIASLSKQITSAAILRLLQDGAVNPQTGQPLQLTDTPFTILGLPPNPNPNGGITHPVLDSITIQELLRHTGGFSRETCSNGCLTISDPEGPVDAFEIESQQNLSTGTCPGGPTAPFVCGAPPNCDQEIEWVLSQPDSATVLWPPGTVHDYSNFGYCVLGALIEKVTGQSYVTWVQNNILEPSGVVEMTPGFELQVLDREVTYYDRPGTSPQQSVWDPQNIVGPVPLPYGVGDIGGSPASGGWVSSPIDLLRFQTTLDGRNGRTPLLTTDSITKLAANPGVPWAEVDTSSDTMGTFVSGNWRGFGWVVNPDGNWFHTGVLDGTLTEQIHFANGFGAALFLNEQMPDTNAIDPLLENAFGAAGGETGDWLADDLFDQYTTYTPWMNWADYQAYFDSQAPLGRYPSRVEGRSQTGTPMYRAIYAPFKGSSFETHHNMDCLTYQQRTAALAALGYQLASLQSFVGDDGLRRYQATWVDWSPCSPNCSQGGACSSNGDCSTHMCIGGICAAPACAPGCGLGSVCGSNADCASAVCLGNTCQAPSCAPQCGDGSPCNSNGDCASFVCAAGTCQAPACAAAPGKCNRGAPCGANADCGSHSCAGGVCQPPFCSPVCVNGAACNNNGDCASFVCGSTFQCQPPVCASSSSKCGRGAPCGASSDCGSGVCTAGQCQPPACAPTCSDGSACNDNGDCASTVCTNATCHAPSCAPNCPTGSRCGANGDCRSRVCTSSGTCK